MSGYTKYQSAWQNYPNVSTPILAAGLQQWEDAIYSLKYLTYNVKDYGAKGDGVTDDTTAIQATITACINAGGGTVYMPAGTYVVSSTLDFSALAGTLTQLVFRGGGSGGTASLLAKGTTRITYTGTGNALKAVATGPASGINGLRFEGFSVRCTANLGAATTYAIYWDGVQSVGGMADVVVSGNGSAATVGSGIAILNSFNGQLTFDNCIAANFKGTNSEGWRVAAQSTTPFVGGINSGNLVFNSCLSNNCYIGWNIIGANSLLNGCTFNSIKAVGYSGASVGIWVKEASGQCRQHVFNAPHVEDHNNAIVLDGCRNVVVNSPLCTNGTSPANAAILVQNTATGNEVHAAYVTQFQNAVQFSGASGNYASARVPTALSGATFVSGASDVNQIWDMASPYFTGQQIDKATKTTTTAVSATTAAAADTVVSGNSVSLSGSQDVWVEVSCPDVEPNVGAGAAIAFVLYDGATQLGLLGYVWSPTANANVQSFYQRFQPATPSAGSHQYILKAYRLVGNGNINAGAGGAGTLVPAYIRVVAA